MSGLTPALWSRQIMIITLKPCGPLRLPVHPRGCPQTCKTGSPASVKRALHFKKRFHPFSFYET